MCICIRVCLNMIIGKLIKKQIKGELIWLNTAVQWNDCCFVQMNLSRIGVDSNANGFQRREKQLNCCYSKTIVMVIL